MLSDVCIMFSDIPWRDEFLSVAEGMASDLSRSDKSCSTVGDRTRDSSWPGKSSSTICGIDDAPEFDKSPDSSSPCLGESLSDAIEIFGGTLSLGKSLSSAEETPRFASTSHDVRMDNDPPRLGNPLHCCATVLIWV